MIRKNSIRITTLLITTSLFTSGCSLINKEKYHIEYSESDNKTIINIHNKTLELENK